MADCSGRPFEPHGWNQPAPGPVPTIRSGTQHATMLSACPLSRSSTARATAMDSSIGLEYHQSSRSAPLATRGNRKLPGGTDEAPSPGSGSVAREAADDVDQGARRPNVDDQLCMRLTPISGSLGSRTSLVPDSGHRIPRRCTRCRKYRTTG
jgi:hypothetical protein